MMRWPRMREENINDTAGCLNCMALFLSAAIVVGGIWMAYNAAATDCDNYFQNLIVLVGVFLFVVSLLGIISACGRINWLLFLHLVLMFLLIVALFCFTIFAVVATKAAEVRGDSNWLQKRVISTKNWNRIKECLVDGKLCENQSQTSPPDDDEFVAQDYLSAIEVIRLQSGCCKPPERCNLNHELKSRTVSRKKNSTDDNLLMNPDCDAWSYDHEGLCFECQSCKAVVLVNLESRWRSLAIDSILFIVCLITIWAVGCCAFYTNWRVKNPPHA